jgi:hypothetical protein
VENSWVFGIELWLEGDVDAIMLTDEEHLCTTLTISESRRHHRLVTQMMVITKKTTAEYRGGDNEKKGIVLNKVLML